MVDSTLHNQRVSLSIGAAIGSKVVGWLGAKMMPKLSNGSITITLPNGHRRTLGNQHTGLHAAIKLNNFSVIRECMQRGTVGFAAAYMNGDVEVDDLTALFRFFLQNREQFADANPGLFKKAAQDFAYHVGRSNTRKGSKENISAHYDLGNDFYSEWLDPSMTYSSAVFEHAEQSLPDAQRAKYHLVADMAGVKEGESILEVGCGWGGMAETIAKDYNAHLRGITLSKEQLKFANERMVRQGLDDLATLHLEDYRDTMGQFDHVVSIEMIEAVGEEHWPAYFQTIHDRLKPGGTAAIQAIVIDEADFEGYKSGPDFIQRYIFPGGMLLTNQIMKEQGERAGLALERVELFGKSYAKTLRLWHECFLERWHAIEPLGYDEIFRRKWAYYLSYCEAGFEEGMIDVGVYQYRRAD